jgi:PilZ domain
MTDQRLAERRALSDTTVCVVDHESGVQFAGAANDVSNTGLSFRTELEPPVGADMSVRLQGSTALEGTLTVTRVSPGAGGFDVAGRLFRLR